MFFSYIVVLTVSIWAFAKFETWPYNQQFTAFAMWPIFIRKRAPFTSNGY